MNISCYRKVVIREEHKCFRGHTESLPISGEGLLAAATSEHSLAQSGAVYTLPPGTANVVSELVILDDGINGGLSVCFYTMPGIPIAFLHSPLMMAACIGAKQLVISFVGVDAVQNVLH